RDARTEPAHTLAKDRKRTRGLAATVRTRRPDIRCCDRLCEGDPGRGRRKRQDEMVAPGARSHGSRTDHRRSAEEQYAADQHAGPLSERSPQDTRILVQPAEMVG